MIAYPSIRTSPHIQPNQSPLPPPYPSLCSDLYLSSSGCRGTDEVFEEFDAENPLGAASIGQCHMARLKGSGKLVAVKVPPLS